MKSGFRFTACMAVPSGPSDRQQSAGRWGTDFVNSSMPTNELWPSRSSAGSPSTIKRGWILAEGLGQILIVGSVVEQGGLLVKVDQGHREIITDGEVEKTRSANEKREESEPNRRPY